jgi:hypothetical protein
VNKFFFHSGDCGDCIACLPIIRALGGGKLLLGTRPWTKPFTTERFESIKPLIEKQPYITSVERHDGELASDIIDFSTFRSSWGKHNTLTGKQAIHVGVDPNALNMSPWIDAMPYEKNGKIAICRSTRNKGLLKWFAIWRWKVHDSFFVGLKEDYDQFCQDNNPWPTAGFSAWHKSAYHADIPFVPTPNLLEVARLIMGARLFVTNQTAALWIAYGMGFKPILIEKTTEDSYLPCEGRRYVARVEENPTDKEFQAL